MREYARTSYIRNLLFSTETEQRALESAWYFEDAPIYGDTVIGDNKTQSWRKNALKDGKSATIYTPVYSDIIQSETYIPDHTDLTIRFCPAKTINCVIQRKSKVKSGEPPTEREKFLTVKVSITHAELQDP